MKKNIALISTFVLLIISKSNDIYQFTQNLKTFNIGSLNWVKLLDVIGTVMFPIMCAYFIWRTYKIEDFFEKEKIEYENFKSQKAETNRITDYNKQLVEVVEYDRTINKVSLRIFRDAWLIPFIMQTEESKEEYAAWFYKAGLNKNEMQGYGIPQEIIDKVIRIHHEEEAKKLK